MTDIVNAPAARPARTPVVIRFVAGVPALWRRWRKERRMRATINTLHRLNDRTLRDIGLERGDIEPAVRSRLPGRFKP
jgi:uncharacterized protein YjiS (DUF1127 family)